MVRHMFVTALIVISIYVGLLFAIGHPFVQHVEAKSTKDITEDSPLVEVLTEEATTVGESPKKIERTEVSLAQSAIFKGRKIVGVSATVNLTDAENQVSEVWALFLDNKVLINNVNWSKGNLKAYAYFSDFSADMSQARLTIGFDEADLKLNSSMQSVILPTGHYERFFVDPNTGVASDEAWAKAYLHKNLVERHTLNRNGESVSTDAIVILN